MSKRKNFREWLDEDEAEYRDDQYSKYDGKRFDKNKRKVQEARRNRRTSKESFFSEDE